MVPHARGRPIWQGFRLRASQELVTMSICTVNGSAHEAATGLQTWGELLTALEKGHGPSRTVVAAVRFAGVGQPTFRAPGTLALELSAVAPIDVELSTGGELVESARQSIIASLDALATSARETADAFRLHDLPHAHSGLADFVATFQLLTTLTAAVDQADAANGDPGTEARGADMLERLRVSLESLVECEVNEDWLSVADVLEYEVAEILPIWASVLSESGAGLHGSATASALEARS
jgi:hypothetical protein